MKILYIAHEGHMGGATKSLLTLAELMKQKGHDVSVLVPLKNSEIEKTLKERGINTITCFYSWWQVPKNEGRFLELAYRIAYKFNGIALQRVKRRLRNENIDVIHSNSSVIEIGMKLSKALNKPHVWHFREFGEDDMNIAYIKGRENSLKLVDESDSKIIYISEAMRQYYSKWINPEKGTVIYNGVSEEYYTEKCAKDYNKDGITKFLISGALQPGKGQDCAIRAAGILKKQGITNFKIYIAGRSIADYEKSLRRLCNKEDVEDVVEFVGFVSDMKTLRENCDVELVCSKKEAFGRVTIEAMLSSNPVIASNAGANPELVRDGENGFLYTYNVADDLAKNMEKFIGNVELLKKMGEKACNMAKNNFTAERNAANVEELYYEIVQKRGEK